MFSTNALANTNLIQNSNFTGTSFWIFSPSVGSFGFDSARLVFYRVSMTYASVSQTVQLPSAHSSRFQFRVDACCYFGGSFDVRASFFDANNHLVDTIGFAGDCPAYMPALDSTLRTMAFQTSIDVMWATTATVTLRGLAKSNKAGTYGPQMSNIVLKDFGSGARDERCSAKPRGHLSLRVFRVGIFVHCSLFDVPTHDVDAVAATTAPRTMTIRLPTSTGAASQQFCALRHCRHKLLFAFRPPPKSISTFSPFAHVQKTGSAKQGTNFFATANKAPIGASTIPLHPYGSDVYIGHSTHTVRTFTSVADGRSLPGRVSPG